MVKNIQAATFPNVFLRLDGTGVSEPSLYGGVVNAQYNAGPWEQFNIVIHSDGTVSLESVAFPNIFVMLDSGGITSYTPGGGGIACAEYGDAMLCRFNMVPRNGGTVSFESVNFPNVFLRLDGSSVTGPCGSGSGVVNAQYTVGPCEQFFLPDAS